MFTQELVKSFNRQLKNIRDERQEVGLETAFIQWYVDTRFEKNFEKNITDGPKDGGIDAVVFDGKNIFVIQSEFCNAMFRRLRKIPPLSMKKYAQFDGLPNIFRNQYSFDRFKGTVDTSLHPIYKKIFEALQQDPSSITWEITTLHSRSKAGEDRLQNLDTADIRYAADNLRLYELSLEGATPPATPLELNFTEVFIVDDAKNNIKSYVAQVYLKDFIDYIDNDLEFRVLARNVRSELTDRIAKKIKNEMIKTYENCPWEFWYSHNGITIICDKASIKGKRLYTIAPYIINGAQTIHALKGLPKRDPEAKVLVRVIEIPSEGTDIKKFINSIIFRTNQQNRIYAYDLRANDVFQVKLANKFLNYKIFYERRRGDWDLHKRIYKNQGLYRLKSKELAQILASCQQDLGGVSLAKTRTDELFSDEYYDKIFNISFEELLFKYKLYLFIRKSLYLIRSKKIKARDRNHALLSCFSIAWCCLESEKKLKCWYRTNEITPSKFSLQNKDSESLKRIFQALFRETWKRWQSAHERDETLDPHDFFKMRKWNNALLKKLCPKFASRIQAGINSMLI